ncbi:hypothetical protein NQ318_001690 [Aromia moschata]|uniref:Uncharacterized protein n=1 Tax=Aromia moschata TaxID=1265417 RepID=A0AAV8Y5E1_9CUCU|nr:hypothetical protein NQ318_001690 [Aromia moschata]
MLKLQIKVPSMDLKSLIRDKRRLQNSGNRKPRSAEHLKLTGLWGRRLHEMEYPKIQVYKKLLQIIKCNIWDDTQNIKKNISIERSVNCLFKNYCLLIRSTNETRARVKHVRIGSCKLELRDACFVGEGGDEQ